MMYTISENDTLMIVSRGPPLAGPRPAERGDQRTIASLSKANVPRSGTVDYYAREKIRLSALIADTVDDV